MKTDNMLYSVLKIMPRYKECTAKNILALEKYFEWKDLDKETQNKFYGGELDNFLESNSISHFDLVLDEDVYDFYSHYANKDNNYKIQQELISWSDVEPVHQWFVENIQKGINDYNFHEEVTFEKLTQFLCVMISNLSCDLIEPCYPIYSIKQQENNEILLSPCDGVEVGFNDGRTQKVLNREKQTLYNLNCDYNNYQLVIESCLQLSNLLNNIDFNSYMVYYISYIETSSSSNNNVSDNN